TSAAVPITVYDSLGTPLVQFTSPLNSALFIGPTNLTLKASASAPAGVTNVQFLANGTVVGHSISSPYSAVWTNASYGTDSLAAVAFDANGLSATSAVVSVIVQTNDNPNVNMTGPANNASYLAPANITLSATATDAQGIAKVEFYTNGVRLAQASG